MAEMDFVGSTEQLKIRKAQDAIYDLEQWLKSNGYGDKEYGMAFNARCRIGDVENSIRFKFKHADVG